MNSYAANATDSGDDQLVGRIGHFLARRACIAAARSPSDFNSAVAYREGSSYGISNTTPAIPFATRGLSTECQASAEVGVRHQPR